MGISNYVSTAFVGFQKLFDKGMRAEMERGMDHEQTIIMTREKAAAARNGIKPKPFPSGIQGFDFLHLSHDDPKLAYALSLSTIVPIKKPGALDSAQKPPTGTSSAKPKESPRAPGRSLKDIFLMVTTAASIILGGTALYQQGKNSTLTDRVDSLEKEVQTLRADKRMVTGKITAVAKSAEQVLEISKTLVAQSQQQAESDQYRLRLSESLSELEGIKARMAKKAGVPLSQKPITTASSVKKVSVAQSTEERPVTKKIQPRQSFDKSDGPALKLKPSNLLLGLLSRVNSNLPEGSSLRAEPSEKGTRIVYDDPSYTRYHTHEAPENIGLQTEVAKKTWAEQQYIRGIDCQRAKQGGVPKKSQPYYCSSAK